VPGVAFTSFGCIGQMNPLVLAGRSLISGRAVPGIISWPDVLAASTTINDNTSARMSLKNNK
jgi:hypothetical protein